MDIYTALRAYADQSATDKLIILRHECITPLNSIQGYCALLQLPSVIDDHQIPSAIIPWIQHIAAAGKHIHDALFALTDPGTSDGVGNDTAAPRPDIL